MALIKRKQKIIDASIELFAEHGIADVSVSMIAKKIGASRGIVYYHFKKGKHDIISAILQIFEACVRSSIPTPTEWESKDANTEQILFKLFITFPEGNALQLRKIIRIIMANMFIDEQIKNYAVNLFIIGREKMLTECLQALANNGKILPVDVSAMARYFNRYLIVCAIEDAIRYPFKDDEKKAREVQERVVRDCTAFIANILADPT